MLQVLLNNIFMSDLIQSYINMIKSYINMSLKSTVNILWSFTAARVNISDIRNSHKHHCTAYPQETCIHAWCISIHHIKNNGVVHKSIRAQPFSTYHGKTCSDHVIFIPTWMPKRAQDLDLRHDADYQLLSYGAYVYEKLGNRQWAVGHPILTHTLTWRS